MNLMADGFVYYISSFISRGRNKAKRSSQIIIELLFASCYIYCLLIGKYMVCGGLITKYIYAYTDVFLINIMLMFITLPP